MNFTIAGYSEINGNAIRFVKSHNGEHLELP